MNRLLIAGLFILSLAVLTGCPNRQAQKPDTKRPSNNMGMDGQETVNGQIGKLDPPPIPTIPESERK